MKSINFVVLGDWSIASELGKKGTVTDMTFYERKSPAGAFSFIAPTSFPEKIQPLVQAIALCEYAILNVKTIDKALGEQIVALDAMGMSKGFIIANGFDEDVRKIVKSTLLENYEFLTFDELRLKIDSVESLAQEGKFKVVLDACFEVKGIGTVALGVVRRGEIKKYDEVEILPGKVKASVRSIQMHDDDVDSAKSPGRVGVALKGTNASEVTRGDVMAFPGSMRSESAIKVRFEKSKFYRGEILPTSSYHMCIGLQIKPVKVAIDGDMSVVAERPFAFEAGERCVLLDLNSTSVRILGSGTVL